VQLEVESKECRDILNQRRDDGKVYIGCRGSSLDLEVEDKLVLVGVPAETKRITRVQARQVRTCSKGNAGVSIPMVAHATVARKHERAAVVWPGTRVRIIAVEA
jgi:hypothetical protein